MKDVIDNDVALQHIMTQHMSEETRKLMLEYRVSLLHSQVGSEWKRFLKAVADGCKGIDMYRYAVFGDDAYDSDACAYVDAEYDDGYGVDY